MDTITDGFRQKLELNETGCGSQDIAGVLDVEESPGCDAPNKALTHITGKNVWMPDESSCLDLGIGVECSASDKSLTPNSYLNLPCQQPEQEMLLGQAANSPSFHAHGGEKSTDEGVDRAGEKRAANEHSWDETETTEIKKENTKRDKKNPNEEPKSTLQNADSMQFAAENMPLPARTGEGFVDARELEERPNKVVAPGLRTNEQVLDAIGLLLDAPNDMPDRTDAVEGLLLALKSVAIEYPSVELLIQAVEGVGEIQSPSSMSMQGVLVLSRRKGLHRIYAVAREIGHAHVAGRALDPTFLKIFACHCIRSLLAGYQPSASTLAKLRKALIQKTLSTEPTTRSKALISAKKGVEEAVRGNPGAASDFGLLVVVCTPERELNPVELFNIAFRRRTDNLIEFATRDAVAGAGGYDTLSAAGLLHSGQQILARVEAGDTSALVVALEIVTHLPSETLLQTPIFRSNCSHGESLAWIDIANGEYCYTLYRLLEMGAKVPEGKEHLYEEATQVVSKKLSPPILRLVQELDLKGGHVATNLGEITGADAAHHPRSAVVEGTGYKVTARRLQESIPALMLQEGMHRWPVALSTNSHFLLTRGRRQYGACRSEEIHKVVCRECMLLGWPEPESPLESRLVGAPSVPTSSAVTKCLNFLSVNADRHSGKWTFCDDVVQGMNAHAQWTSGLTALSLALRMWLVYQIQLDINVPCGCAHFNDKDVHEFDGPGVPIVNLLRDSLGAWIWMCRAAVDDLNGFGDARSIKLAKQITEKLQDGRGIQVFTIDAVDRIQPVGYKTWHDALPINIRLKPNYSRQFWPLKLTDHGVVQLTMDILMRHQFQGFPPGSTHSSHKLASNMGKLLKAMNSAIDGLGLQVPILFKGANDGK